jgi:DNA polymerase-3 subunit delta
MAAGAFFSFLNLLASDRDIPPYILLHGFNESLGEVIIGALCNRFLSGKTEFNFRRYYFETGSDDSWDAVVEEARSSSFFIESRKVLVAVVREEKRVKLSGEARKILLDYIGNPNPNTILVHYLSLNCSKDDFRAVKRSKIAPLIKEVRAPAVRVVDLDDLSESEVRTYIKEYLKTRGITITASALDKMFDLKGDDFAAVIGQLPKLEISVNHERSLDTEDIDKVITGIESHSIWDLTEAIEREDISKYLETLRYLFINGVKPHFILGTLIAHYNKIFTAKFLLKHNFPVSDIGKVLQQPQFMLNKFIRSVQGFSDSRLQQILRVIYKIDTELKTSGDEAARLSLQNFIFQIRLLSPRR